MAYGIGEQNLQNIVLDVSHDHKYKYFEFQENHSNTKINSIQNTVGHLKRRFFSNIHI
jgi:hypothetical protein